MLFSLKGLHFLEMNLSVYFPGDKLESRYTDRFIKSPLMSKFMAVSILRSLCFGGLVPVKVSSIMPLCILGPGL